jgi:hypothetical protein
MTPGHITITHIGAETCVIGSCHLIRFQPDHGTKNPEKRCKLESEGLLFLEKK